MDILGADNVSHRKMLISSATRLVTSITRLGQSCYPAAMSGLLDGFTSILSLFESIVDLRIVCVLIRPFLQSLRTGAKDSMSPEIVSKCDKFITDANDKLCNRIYRTCLEDPGEFDVESREEPILLLADMIRYSSRQKDMPDWFDQHGTTELLIDTVEQLFVSTLNDRSTETRLASYVVTSIADSKLQNAERRKRLLMSIISGGNETSRSIENAFCALTSDISAEQVQDAVDALLDASNDPWRVVRSMRLFHLLVSNLDVGRHGLGAISRVAPSFVSRCLEVLSKPNKNDTQHQCEVATTLLLDLASNKDIIHLSPRYIALILGTINSTLGTSSDTSTGTGKVTHAYTSCFRIMSFLLQRFSKQLFVCVPSLICAMNAMLVHALSKSLTETEVVSRAQKFARLCELISPHRDVYKKHVLSMLLEFVHAIRNGMSYTHKTNLTPAVYILLDMLSQFEIRQLNSLMDTTSKALFRSINESYQRIHTYRGT